MTVLHDPLRLRRRLLTKLSDAAVRACGGPCLAAFPTFDAVRQAKEVAEQDREYREQISAFCKGVWTTLSTVRAFAHAGPFIDCLQLCAQILESDTIGQLEALTPSFTEVIAKLGALKAAA